MEGQTRFMNGTACRQTFTFDLFVTLQDITCVQECLRSMVFHVGNCLNSVVVLISLVVVCSRKLFFPRLIFVVAITFFEFVILCQYFLELAVIVNQDLLACQTFVLLASVSYSFVLLILSQCILSRYLDIVGDETREELLSLWDFVLLLTINCALIFVVDSCPLWTSYQPVSSCDVDSTYVVWTFIWDMFMSIVCITVYFTIFMESKAPFLQVPKTKRKSVTPILAITPTSNIRPGNSPLVMLSG